MSLSVGIDAVTLSRLRRLAEGLALKLRAGDVVALHGDLGAGKTTFARFLIRALLGDADAEVPSPTFPIVQHYDTPRFAVTHFDLYRLADADELEEVGFSDACGDSLVLIEWPDRAGASLPSDRIDIHIEMSGTGEQRCLRIEGQGAAVARIERAIAIDAFLDRALPGAGDIHICYLQGDASPRAYARLRTGTGNMVLMDAPRAPDGPPMWNGLPYSRIAHLAEDVKPFVAVGTALASAGLHVPRLLASDIDAGLLLLEDLGDQTFGVALAAGEPQGDMIGAAVDVLLHLRRHRLSRSLPLPDGGVHHLPRFDRAALEIEIGLILDWFWPAVKGGAASPDIRAEFMQLWSPILDRMLAATAGLFLRDYHSPNLFWLPERQGIARIGVIDFQDALAEPWAYDLASLLQDARVDVPAAIETVEVDRYCREVAAHEPDFDAAGFRALYAIFGAQRNTRLVGLWVRLLKRDGKPGYLQHMARTWDYLARNLRHPALADLAAWYDRHFPEAVRKQPIPR